MADTSPAMKVATAAAAATAATAASVTARNLVKARETAYRLDDNDDLVVVPSRDLGVVADDGVLLHVEIDDPDPAAAKRLGKGAPTFVFAHGFTMGSGSWVFQRRALTAAGYRVVVWDQRGHGRSARGSRSSYTIDQLGDDLASVIAETVPTGDIVLVGHSMGGMTMLALGEGHRQIVQDRVIAAAFVATSAGGIALANGGVTSTLAREFLGKFGPGVLTPLAKRPGFVRRILSVGRDIELGLIARYSFGSPVAANIVELVADELDAVPLDVIRDYLKTFDGFDKRRGLQGYAGVATLVFNGTRDVMTPPEHSELIVAGIPGAEHLMLDGAGHCIMLENPDLLNAQLIALATRAQAARAAAAKGAARPKRLAAARGPVRRVVTDIAHRRKVRRAEQSTS